MLRSFVSSLSFCLIIVVSSFACWCGPPGPASIYVRGSKVVFVGKVAFTNDDWSGRFSQKTLVRFEVEEAYKGINLEDHNVWIDPGSFTSCYATYHVGERYLVFANREGLSPHDSAFITAIAENRSTTKPVPTGFDPKNPPPVYGAPECSGTRQITPRTTESVTRDVEYLRKYRVRCGALRSTLVPGEIPLDCD